MRNTIRGTGWGRPWRGRSLIALVGAVAVAAAASLVISVAVVDDRDPAVVETEHGLVRGTVTGQYAPSRASPTPPHRLARGAGVHPALRRQWTGVRDATTPSSPCPQGGDFIGDPPSDEEDCLYLNVTTPIEAGEDEDRKLPVMVWIHGGGFMWGSGGIYGAERLAAQGDIIVVTFNYCLGVFGFLAHPALDGGPAEHLSGNYGIEDQQAALRWVQGNAAAFGGDPDNVTIFGESAGGMSSCVHLTAPGSAGLFDRVIMQSGPCTLRWQFPETWRPKPRDQAVEQAITIATKAGCVDAAAAAGCLRSKTPAELLDAEGGEHGLGPTYGGEVIPQDPALQLIRGDFAAVPVMHGITATSTRRSRPASKQ